MEAVCKEVSYDAYMPQIETQCDHSSKYVGVSWYKKSKKWRAYLYDDKKLIHIGYFNTEIEAVRAYNQAAKKYNKKLNNIITNKQLRHERAYERKVQKRFGTVYDSRSSRAGCRVESLIEEKLDENDEIHKYYISAKCVECEDSEVLYNKYGEEQCTKCGLIQSECNLENWINYIKRKHGSSFNYKLAGNSDGGSTYDRYFAKAYGIDKSKIKIMESEYN